MKDSWDMIWLSRDHNPSIPEEKQRIMKSGGRIEASKYPDGSRRGPKRIWRKMEDVPGLMMSRSFGDRVGHSCGIISTPEVKVFQREESHKCLVLGSDGMWEV